MYHKVSDPCDLSRDRVCPMKCTEVNSTTADGADCTLCDCQGNVIIIATTTTTTVTTIQSKCW